MPTQTGTRIAVEVDRIAAHADSFFMWHESFVVNGKNDMDQEKTGRLQYLSPDLKSVLITVDFSPGF